MPDLENIEEYLKYKTRSGPETPQSWMDTAERAWKYASGQIEGTSIHSVRSALERLPEIMYNPATFDKLPMLAMELAGLALGGSVGVGGMGAGPRLPKGFHSRLYKALEEGKAGKFELGSEPKAASLLANLRKGGITEDELNLSMLGKVLEDTGQGRITLDMAKQVVDANYPLFSIRAMSGRAQHERDALHTALQGQNIVLDRLPDLSDKIDPTIDKITKLERQRDKLLPAQYANWSTNKGAPTTKPKSQTEERLLDIHGDSAPFTAPHWQGLGRGVVGHSRIDEAQLVIPTKSGYERYLGDNVTHIDEIQSDWNIAASKEPEKFFKRGERERYEDIGKVSGPPIRSGNIERTLVRDTVRRAWEKGSKGITWTPAEVQAERYGRLIDRVDWVSVPPEKVKGVSGYVQIGATMPDGRTTTVGVYRPNNPGDMKELEFRLGGAIAKAVQKSPTEGSLEGRQMFKAEKYQNVYDKLLPRIFKEEYGVTPEKKQIYSHEFGRDIDVWYVPLTEEMKQKAFKGQPFAFNESIFREVLQG